MDLLPVRVFIIRTKPWSHGLVVQVWEPNTHKAYGESVPIGMTQTYDEYRIVDAIEMARDWVGATYGLPDEQFEVYYSMEALVED